MLSQVKIIAEPWDMGPYGYQSAPSGWSEWNDRFGTISATFGGATPTAWVSWPTVARLPDIFSRDDRTSAAGVNFVTAHDGFLLRDLVTYNVTQRQRRVQSRWIRRQSVLELRR